MIYRFTDDRGTFVVRDPARFGLYFPLTDASGGILGSVSPNLAGDVKQDNDRFLMPPASVEDLRSNLLCRREFFIRCGRRLVRCSFPLPGDTAEYGLLYQKITKRVSGMAIEILNFVPHDMPVEVMRVRLTNVSAKKIDILATSFLPLFGRSEKNLRDHRHVSSLLNRVTLDRYGITLKPTMIFDETGHRLNRTSYIVRAYEGKGIAPAGQFPTLDSFMGASDILHPDAVENGLAPVTHNSPEFDGKEACAAFRFRKATLAPGESREYVMCMGITEDESRLKTFFSRLDRPRKIDAALAATKRFWVQYVSGTRFDFADRDFNNWLIWVSLQPALRTLFGCSFLPHFDYGKGGRGWRDLWQDALALLIREPDRAKSIIAGSFRGVRVDGSNATIITRSGDFIADRNRINRVWMDHGVWPYLTTRLYINRAGDTRFLLGNASYFRDHQLDRAKTRDTGFAGSDFLLRDGRGRVYKGSILEHILVQALVQFFNVGSHNITRLENADWNDGLDMAAEKGESVAFSHMYAYILADLTVFLRELRRKHAAVPLMKELLILLDRLPPARSAVDYGDFRARQRQLERYFAATRAISGDRTKVPLDALIGDLTAKSGYAFDWLRRREWLAAGFFNGYYDNKGRRVEGSSKSGTRMTLPAQVFALMSGAADNRQAAAVWRSAEKHLKDARFGGFRLNTDFGSAQTDLGRAFGFSYGDKENGAFFSHMSVMFAYSLYKRGMVREGSRVLGSLYEMARADRAGIPPCIPEYFNARGRGLYLYLTGSASWYIYTLFEQVLGIEFELGGIRLAPKLISDQLRRAPVRVSFIFNSGTVEVIYTASRSYPPGKPLDASSVRVNGQPVSPDTRGFFIPPSLLKKKKNGISVTLA